MPVALVAYERWISSLRYTAAVAGSPASANPMTNRVRRKRFQSSTRATSTPSTEASASDQRMRRTRPIRSEIGTARMRPMPRPAVAKDTESAATAGLMLYSRVKYGRMA